MSMQPLRIRKSRSLPLVPVPAGIEMVGLSAAVTHLLPRNAAGVVSEGQRVAAGQPLCRGAKHGAFASSAGVVRRVMPWDRGPHGFLTAVRIACEPSDDRHAIGEPVRDQLAADPSVLRSACAALGFPLPDDAAALLVLLVDEDVGCVTNRWFLEKEFEKVLCGIQLLDRLFTDTAIHIAAPSALSHGRRKKLSAHGRIIPLAMRYPAVLPVLIAKNVLSGGTGGKIAVIEGWRLVALSGALAQGCAVTTTQVALRIGRNGQTRLFEVPVGISLRDFLDGRGVRVDNGAQVVLGGEMRGTAVDTLDQPLAADTGAVLVFPSRAAAVPENTPCVGCGRCNRVCPAGLRVDLLGKCVEFSQDEELLRLDIDQCIDCGMCAAWCIVRRPLAHLMAYGKRRVLRAKEASGG